MTHRGAAAAMVAATLMWSIAGVVTRHLDAARSFEVTFWRALFSALALAALLAVQRGPGMLLAQLRQADRTLWTSALCWCVMFTAFMLAMTMTTVANVLVTMALAPLFTALLARAALGHRLAARTWTAIALAASGIAWMYGSQVHVGDARHWVGTAIGLTVPLAAAVNWTVLQHQRGRAAGGTDMMPAVLMGALMCVALTFPAAVPFVASGHDLLLLALLGTVQLAIPCLVAVHAARVLAAPEAALLALLEVVFGVAWAWIGAGETPSAAVLGGGLLVLAALAANELLGLRRPALG